MSKITDTINMAESARQAGNLDNAVRIMLDAMRAMVRPELTYCVRCDGVILRIDDATQDDDGDWMCAICRERGTIEDQWDDATAFDRGEQTPVRDQRDEYDGGEELRFINF